MTYDEWMELDQEERDAWKALFDVIREYDPTFEAMVQALRQRYDLVLHMRNDPEQDSILAMMHQEINASIRPALEWKAS